MPRADPANARATRPVSSRRPARLDAVRARATAATRCPVRPVRCLPAAATALPHRCPRRRRWHGRAAAGPARNARCRHRRPVPGAGAGAPHPGPSARRPRAANCAGVPARLRPGRPLRRLARWPAGRGFHAARNARSANRARRGTLRPAVRSPTGWHRPARRAARRRCRGCRTPHPDTARTGRCWATAPRSRAAAGAGRSVHRRAAHAVGRAIPATRAAACGRRAPAGWGRADSPPAIARQLQARGDGTDRSACAATGCRPARHRPACGGRSPTGRRRRQFPPAGAPLRSRPPAP